MTDYRRIINNLRWEGIHYRTFINDDGNMVIHYGEDDKNYNECIFNPAAKLIQVISVDDGYKHIQGGNN